MFGFDLWKLAGGGVAVAVLVGSCVARDMRIEQRGGTKVVTASKTAGKQANATNDKVRTDARKPGAAERLLADPSTCRDCR